MGFPSPADDFLEQALDLNKLLVRRPNSTFFMRAEGSSGNAGIDGGDIIIIDKSLKPENNELCVCWCNGQFMIKRIFKTGTEVLLLAHDNDANPVPVSDECEIWGIITHTVKMYKDVRARRL